jgi:hypothetical protein
MTEKPKPAAPPPSADGSVQAPTQPFNWLPIVGFLALTAALIAAAYYLMM